MWRSKFPIPRILKKHICLEIIIRAVMLILFIYLEYQSPFERKIYADEMGLYRNPRTLSYIPARYLWALGVFATTAVFLLFYLIDRDFIDLIQAHLGASLSMVLSCCVTDILKLCIGRPRPDFFWRCFPNGEMNKEMNCTGDPTEVSDGRKSFPSGHSAYAFACFGFATLYLFGKLHVFNEHGRGHSWRLIASMLPAFVALAIAISRLCDYHHHWQDISVGSLIGITFAYLCYRQYYPALNSPCSHLTYVHLLNRDSEGGPVCLGNDEVRGSSKLI